MWIKTKRLINESIWKFPLLMVRVSIYSSDRNGKYVLQIYHKWFFKWILVKDIRYNNYVDILRVYAELKVVYNNLGKLLVTITGPHG